MTRLRHYLPAVLIVAAAIRAIDGPTTQQPSASCRDARYRALDFWVGDWDVTNPAGQPAGTSVIEVVSDGCAIVERFAGPGRRYVGTGLHVFDPSAGTWRQFFSDNRPVLTIMKGDVMPNGILYTWDAVDAKGSRVPKRYTLTTEADGVRQHGERSDDGGKTWVTEFDLRYKKTSHR